MKKSRYLNKAGSIYTPMLATPLGKCTNFRVVFMLCILSILTSTSGLCQWTPASNCTGNGTKLKGTVLGSTDRAWNDKGGTKEKAFDDDNDTYFDAPTGNNQWAGLDLGSVKKLTCIMFRPRTEWPSRMAGGLIQVSSDVAFTNPVTIYTMPSTIVVQDYYINNIQSVSETETRYVRYLSPDGGYGNIAEMKVYGGEVTGKPVPAPTNTFPQSGFVGIGTTNPNKELDVVGTIRATHMVATGKVGIGTITPGKELDVNGTIKATGFEFPTGASANKVLTSDDKGVATWQLLPSLSSISKTGTGSESEIGLEVYQSAMGANTGLMFQIGKSNTAKNAGNLKFIHKGEASENNLLTLGFQGKNDILNVIASGKVGIGTTEPTAKLEIKDSDATLKIRNTNDNGGIQILNSYNAAYFGMYNASGSVWGTVPANDSKNFFAIQNNGKVGSVTNSGGTSANFRNVLDDGSGKMGVGTSNPTAKLDVDGEIRIRGGSPEKDRVLTTSDKEGNATWQSVGKLSGWIASGTTTNPVTSTSTSGKVGIGTITPGTELDVNGTIKATGFEFPTDAIAGKVLTSDDKGVATWQLLPSLSSISKAGKGSENEIGLEVYQPDMLDNTGLMFQIGKSNTAKNAGNLKFIHKGEASENNLLTLGFQGKSDILNVTASGKVGIGTTEPTAKLEIKDSDATLKIRNTNDNGGIQILNSYNAAYFGMYNASGSVWGTVPANDSKNFFAIQNNGKVGSVTNSGGTSANFRNVLDDGSGKMGVGTSNPTAKLDVDGEIRIRGGSPEKDRVLTTSDKEGNATWQSVGRLSGWIASGTTTNPVTSTSTSGKVGIGTITPGTELDVNGTIKATGLEFPTGARANKVLTSDDKGVATWQLLPSLSSISKTGTGSKNEIGLEIYQPKMEVDNGLMFQIGKSNTAKNAGNLKFINKGEASENNLLTLGFQGKSDILNVTASGKVGIGTTEPTAKLEIKDSDATVKIRNTKDDGGIQILSRNNAAYFGMYNASGSVWGTVPANNSKNFFAIQNDGKVGSVTNSGGTPAGFRNVLDDGSGKMGVGTSNPTAKLDVDGEIRIRGGSPEKDRVLTSDKDGNATWQSVGRLSGWIASGTTTNPAISTSTSGKVGIGTITPGKELDVNGTIKATGFEFPTDAIAGKVLTSDDKGVATWQPLPSLSSISKTGTGSENEIGLEVYQPGMEVNTGLMFQIGKSNTTKNAGNLKFINKGEASENNLLTLGFPDKDTILNVAATGKVGIGTITPGTELDVNGTIKATGFELSTTDAGADKVLTSNDKGVAGWKVPQANFSDNLTVTVPEPGTLASFRFKKTLPGSVPVTLSPGLVIGASLTGNTTSKSDIMFSINNFNADGTDYRTNFLKFESNPTVTEGGDAATTRLPGKITAYHPLEVKGTIIAEGLTLNKGASDGSVLTSDDNGVATWKKSNPSTLENVGIGTDPSPDHKLTVSGYTYIGAGNATPKGFRKNSETEKFLLWVEGGIVSEDFAIAQASSWKDTVFNEGYKLPSLSEIEKYIQQNKHLPGIPSEMEVKEKGYSLNNLNKAFLEKIEHLTLYSIEQEKKITKLEAQLSQYESLKRELEEIKSALRSNSKN